jgi:hypothetical protein
MLLASGLALVLASLPAQGIDGSGGEAVSPLSPLAPPEAAAPHPRTRTILKRRWGVDVMGVRLSAAGHMVEFRYRVLDAEKAEPLFERLVKPHLIHEGTGAALSVPVPAKTGPLRTSDAPIEGRVYWMFFGNPGLVRVGEKVSVVIGEFRAGGLVVE